MTIFIIEAIGAIFIFTLFILLLTLQKSEDCINSWPPKVKKRIMKEKILLVTDERMTKKEIIRKLVGLILFALIIGLLLRYVNKITTFVPSLITSYALWFIVDWWDAFVIDAIACKWKKMRIKGTEDWDEEYDNLPFHIKQSFIGMILGLPFALLVALFVVLLP